MYFCGNGCKDILYTLNWTKQQLPPNSLQNIHAQPQKKKKWENIKTSAYVFSLTSISFESKFPT